MRKGLHSFALFVLTATLSSFVSLVDRQSGAFKRVQAGINAGAVPEKLPDTSDASSDIPKTLSPYEIAGYINSHPRINLTNLWNALGVGIGEFNGMELNQNPPYQLFPIKCDNCHAELYEYDLDGQPGAEVLLRIGEETFQACRYLIFKPVDTEWTLIGHIDAQGKYRQPHHTILISHGITWLAIQQQGANGSGVASYFDTVFLVTPRRLIRAFAYMADGSQYGGPVSDNREFSGRILDCSLKGNVVTVLAEYSVTYVGNKNVLFAKTHRVEFSQHIGHDNLWFNRKHSDISQDEFDSVYDIDSLSDEDFLKYNYAELSKMATGTDLEKREWLRNFLPTCENTTERRRLSQILSRAN